MPDPDSERFPAAFGNTIYLYCDLPIGPRDKPLTTAGVACRQFFNRFNGIDGIWISLLS